MTNKIKIASVLAFERKLDPSDALLYAGNWETRHQSSAWQPVHLREKSVRGSQSQRQNGSDVSKKNGDIKAPAPFLVDAASLTGETDTLRVTFTLRVLGGIGLPSACNDAACRQKLITTFSGYAQQPGFAELARRYATNLANGRFLWRNRIGAEQIEVQVAQLKDGKALAQWSFQALDYSLLELDAKADELQALAGVIESGLSGSAHVLLQVTAYVRMGDGQEVYPSQEMVLERESGDKSKTLYAVEVGNDAIAAIHSQKIGNALRTIDTWYPQADSNGPIAIEPYGSVTTQGKAYRPPQKGKDSLDFYSLLDNWIEDDQVPSLEQQHYVMANLIRGGVFGKGKE